jgi:hypothetical protein
MLFSSTEPDGHPTLEATLQSIPIRVAAKPQQFNSDPLSAATIVRELARITRRATTEDAFGP